MGSIFGTGSLFTVFQDFLGPAKLRVILHFIWLYFLCVHTCQCGYIETNTSLSSFSKLYFDSGTWTYYIKFACVNNRAIYAYITTMVSWYQTHVLMVSYSCAHDIRHFYISGSEEAFQDLLYYGSSGSVMEPWAPDNVDYNIIIIAIIMSLQGLNN